MPRSPTFATQLRRLLALRDLRACRLVDRDPRQAVEIVWQPSASGAAAVVIVKQDWRGLLRRMIVGDVRTITWMIWLIARSVAAASAKTIACSSLAENRSGSVSRVRSSSSSCISTAREGEQVRT